MLTLFPGLKRTREWSVLTGCPVDTFANLEHREALLKDEVPLFGPYRLREGATGRRDSEVAAITALVLDFDGPNHEGLSDESTLSIIDRLSYYDCAIASSFSHSGSAAKFRAVVRLASEIPPEQWDSVLAIAGTHFPERDRCNGLSHGYYIPSCPPGMREFAFRYRFHGAPFDPDVAAGEVEVAALGAPIHPDAIRNLAKRLQRSISAERQKLASALGAMLDGLPLAEEGARQNMTWAIVSLLCQEFRDATPAQIIATIASSVERQGWPSLRELPSMVGRAQRFAQRETHSTLTDGQREEIFSSLGIDDPIRYLVLQSDARYFVAGYDGTYGLQYTECGKDSLPAQAVDKLAFAGVATTVLNPETNRTRRMKPDELMQAYGMPVDSIVRSFVTHGPEIRYRGVQREIVIPCRQRPIEPHYSPAVGEWLSMFGGDLVHDWVVLALDCARPLAMLVLQSGPSTGKSLFAKSISRIWTQYDPPKLSNVLANFNDDLLRCPVVFADEDLPRDSRGQVRTAELREFVQRDRHPINAKFRAISHLEGFARVVIAANNDEVLDFGAYTMTPEDLAALRERFRIVKVPEESAKFLAKQPVGQWLANDTIPKHFLWLAENRDVEHIGRFGLPPDHGIGLTFNRAGDSNVLEAIVKWLLNPGRVQTQITVDQGGAVVIVRLQDIEAIWTGYLEVAKPSTRHIAASLARIGGADGFTRIPFELLEKWNQQMNYLPKDRLEGLLRDWQPAGRGLRAVV